MTHWMITQLKTAFETLIEEERRKEKMENKMEIMSNEIMEINNIITLAKADDDIKEVFLSNIIQEFDELQLDKTRKSVFFQDTVFEILELARHDPRKKQMFFKALLESELGTDIQDHFFEYFSGNGMIQGNND